MNPEDERTVRADALLSRLRHATLGEYEILDEAGRGGMAVVYLAHDIALDRKVAIKVISPSILWMDERIAERFKREARVSASLSHPHIIPIYAVKEGEDLLCFVMKFVKGRTLEDVIGELGPLPVSMVHTILTQVGGALGYAHRQGVVHRDIKPANIMLDEEGWAVVTDFGIAKVAAAGGLTQTGSAVGTPAYMSPEQCSGLRVTGASDQYGLGVVAYEMLTGRKPFDAHSAMSLMYKHVHARPEPLHVTLPDCPESIAHAVMRMLEKAPADRWPQLEDMVVALGAVPPAESDRVRTQMLELARSSSARAIVERFQTPQSPVPKSRAPERTRPETPAPEAAPDATPHPETPGSAAPSLPHRSPSPGPPTSRRRKLIWAAAPLSLIAALFLWAPWQVGDPSEVDPAPPPVPPGEDIMSQVEVLPSARTLAVGDTALLTITARDGDEHPLELEGTEWASLDPRVARVTPGGLVTAMAPGTAEITASGAGWAATARITVEEEVDPEAPPPPRATVASVSISPGSGSLVEGESLSLQATVRDGEGRTLRDRTVSWASSDERVARVSAAGVVSAVGAGTARITATSEARAESVTITVSSAVTVASIEVSPAQRTLEPGEAVRLAASVRDQRGDPLPGQAPGWTSSDERVVTVSPEGEVTARGGGVARVTASIGDVVGSAEIVVEPVAPEQEVDPRPAVESVVAAYAQALERQDLSEARRYYPAMTRTQEENWAAFFANVRNLTVTMTIQNLSVEESLVRADIEMTLAFRDTRSRQDRSTVRMTLQPEDGTWRIVEVR